MRCPACGKPTAVYRTDTLGSLEVIRHRRCLACPARFTTSERLATAPTSPQKAAKH